MKTRILLVLIFVFLIFQICAAEEKIASGELDLNLNLGEGSYIFGLSSNPITSATPTPNDVNPQLMEMKQSDNTTIGAVGEIAGNTNGNELHFYWNVSSGQAFEVLLGVDTSGDGHGAMKRVGSDEQYLDWTISVPGESGSINNNNYSQKLSLYKHEPTKGRNSYSSKEILIYTEAAGPGTYNGTLIFSIAPTN